MPDPTLKNPSAKEIISMYRAKKESFWTGIWRNNLKKTFRTALGIKAYREFLKKSGWRSKAKIGEEQWQLLPVIDKKNYFRKYSLSDLGITKDKSGESFVVTSTSGSTGKSTYFFRNHDIDWQYSVLIEDFIERGPKGPTLFINCFSMGIWIGGLITYQAFRYAGLRGHPVAIITPGINKKEIFNILRDIAPNYKNLVFAGYPPFVKDIIDESKIKGINLKKYRTRLLFAAESFSENFRDYVAAAAGIKNVYADTLNIYGSAELGAMAFETPGSILIRRLALKHAKIFQDLFRRDSKLPTLAQYNPMFIAFEERDRQVLITADSATPIVRYRIGDNGGVLRYSEIIRIFKANGLDLEREARRAKVKLAELPFVYVHERADFSTTLYGLQIYPQTIKAALEQKKVQKFLSGKFTMSTTYDRGGDQYLELHLELKPGSRVNPKLKKVVENIIVKTLTDNNHEYRELSSMVTKKRTKPRLNFWEFHHPQYFRSGIKQKWLKK